MNNIYKAILKHCVWLCRSEGAIHIWNLNSRRAEKIVEGHSGKPVIWVSTLQLTDALIRSGEHFSWLSDNVSYFVYIFH